MWKGPGNRCMVRIENLNFAYKRESPIFTDFQLTIGWGERWSVIGPSGCGKTTLLYLLAGLRAPEAGRIDICKGVHYGRHAMTGLILQDYGLLPWATAAENVALGLKIHGADKKSAAQIAAGWLKELGIENIAGHYPGELSGGQRQRVAIARTLALEPSLLLMDEPFSSLDAATREDSMILVRNLWRKHTSTAVLVTHNMEEAVNWGCRILVLGTPPHTSAIVLDNPGSETPGYRHSPEFIEKCLHLRTVIQQTSRGGKSGDRL
jgi:ABC-type nitrate/sulfonate/bicarbonate transport system ATPase subunit